MPHCVVVLKKNEERRALAGHPWVFSNEIETSLKELSPGALVTVRSSQGKVLGSATCNPHSLIALRFFDRRPNIELDTTQFQTRIRRAYELRHRLFPAPYYRLVFAEGDELPGLVIDRYGEVFVIQCHTAAMDAREGQIIEALKLLFPVEGILVKNTAQVRELEQLPREERIAFGHVPEVVDLIENGVGLRTRLIGGQKTGYFYDHRENRARAALLARGRKTIDLFAYVGSFGIQAAVRGAAHVTLVDASREACDLIEDNARINTVSDRVEVVAEDAFAYLERCRDEGRKFGTVLVDPPAFIKNRKNMKEGIEGYRRLNRLAMQVVEEDGFLVTSSCSYHMDPQTFRRTVQAAARDAHRRLQILGQGHQGPDHPTLPAMSEGDYLKTLFCRVL